MNLLASTTATIAPKMKARPVAATPVQRKEKMAWYAFSILPPTSVMACEKEIWKGPTDFAFASDTGLTEKNAVLFEQPSRLRAPTAVKLPKQ